MARYGYGMSVSGSRTPLVASSGGAAPSGIPVASTTIINIKIPSFGLDGNFLKLTPDYWSGPEDYLFVFNSPEWQVVYNGEPVSFNAGQTVNFIPQTNWSVPDTTITVVA